MLVTQLAINFIWHTKWAMLRSSTCDCGVTPVCKLSCYSSIEKIVTQQMCSYDRFQDHYMPMTWYECYTCWGGESVIGCCSFCINDHHKGHTVIKHEGELSKFYCDCGKMKHEQPRCTRTTTGRAYIKQPWYNCDDCFQEPDTGCCYACAMNCHEGHRVYFRWNSPAAYCDCGLECCLITCKISS